MSYINQLLEFLRAITVYLKKHPMAIAAIMFGLFVLIISATEHNAVITLQANIALVIIFDMLIKTQTPT